MHLDGDHSPVHTIRKSANASQNGLASPFLSRCNWKVNDRKIEWLQIALGFSVSKMQYKRSRIIVEYQMPETNILFGNAVFLMWSKLYKQLSL